MLDAQRALASTRLAGLRRGPSRLERAQTEVCGAVYRGKQVPELEGAYLYGDYITGQIWALFYDRAKKQVTANRSIQPKGLNLMSFGEDDAGEVYFLLQSGGIMKFAP